MKYNSSTKWVSGVKPCSALLVIKHTQLWPLEMWYGTSDDDTIIMLMPMITPGDICGVIDILADEDDEADCYAALVVCSEGIGCILVDSEYFQLL